MSRLDQELVARGLARSRTHAAKLIAAGRVDVNGATAARAAKQVAPTDRLAVQDAGDEEFVSRAGHKLAGALDAFDDIQVRGLRCLDAGASTGGFTDVLLRRGADRVVAVDVGHGQLVDQIRNDPRVDVHEGLNVRTLVPGLIGGSVDLVVADLSFISLRLVVGPLAAVTRPGGDLVLMVKPQFEVGRDNLGRTGVVTSAELRRRAVHGVVEAAEAAGTVLAGLARSPLPGQDGNVEFFLRLRVPGPGRCPQPGAGEHGVDDVDYS
ncbi:TlyA family RNA methyltransferase [Arthrobacter sp. JSM 101049]|uniref:TlyA family RNA methyltransferase n=1 Tax=Arthrobacter sp. JSM 101049 TaxID=929097 RepID=UPI003565831C